MMKFMEVANESSDFISGYYDCMNGIAHASNFNDEYDNGYNTRHQEEQIAGAES